MGLGVSEGAGDSVGEVSGWLSSGSWLGEGVGVGAVTAELSGSSSVEEGAGEGSEIWEDREVSSSRAAGMGEAEVSSAWAGRLPRASRQQRVRHNRQVISFFAFGRCFIAQVSVLFSVCGFVSSIIRQERQEEKKNLVYKILLFCRIFRGWGNPSRFLDGEGEKRVTGRKNFALPPVAVLQ